MKRVVIYVVAALVIGVMALSVACSPDSAKASADEEFSGDFFKSFPDVRDFVDYLQIESSEVTILSQSKNELVFCLKQDEDIDVNDESIRSLWNYVKALEGEGYESTLYDGTIASGFELISEKYTIWISYTRMEYLDQFRNDRIGEIKNIDKMVDANVLYQIRKNTDQ